MHREARREAAGVASRGGGGGRDRGGDRGDRMGGGPSDRLPPPPQYAGGGPGGAGDARSAGFAAHLRKDELPTAPMSSLNRRLNSEELNFRLVVGMLALLADASTMLQLLRTIVPGFWLYVFGIVNSRGLCLVFYQAQFLGKDCQSHAWCWPSSRPSSWWCVATQ